MEQEVVRGRQCEIIGDLHCGPERRRAAVARHQEAGAALHRRIGVLEERQVRDRQAEQVERCVLIGERSRLLIVDDAGRGNTPQRRHAGCGFARRVFGVRELGDVSILADGPTGSDPGIVGADDAEGFDEAVLEVVGDVDPVGMRERPVGVLDCDIACCRQRVGCLIVDHLVGRDRISVVIKFDIAFGDHTVARCVVGQLVAVEQ